MTAVAYFGPTLLLQQIKLRISPTEPADHSFPFYTLAEVLRLLSAGTFTPVPEPHACQQLELNHALES